MCGLREKIKSQKSIIHNGIYILQDTILRFESVIS